SKLTKGAIEIMTGAPIPSAHFDSVIRVEDTVTKNPGTILLKKRPIIGNNIRQAGEDCLPGQILLPAGTTFRTHHLLALASQGVTQLRVRKRIKTAVISTGKELVDRKVAHLTMGQIRNSTGLYLEF